MYRPRNKDIVSVKPNAYTYSALLKALGKARTNLAILNYTAVTCNVE